MDLPMASGVALAPGVDALDASTDQLVAWLRAQRVPDARLLDAQQLDFGLRGFQRAVLRYGLLRSLIEKGYDVPRDEATWRAFDEAMRGELGA